MLQPAGPTALPNTRNPLRETSAGSGRDQHIRNRVNTCQVEEIIQIVRMTPTKAYARFSMHMLTSMKLL